MEDACVKAALRAQLGPAVDQVAVLCIGNVDRGDDGFGPAVARAVRGRLAARLFEGGTVPENDLPRIASGGAAAVVLVDAVHFGAEAGTLTVLGPGMLLQDDFSTHASSPSVAAHFLEAACGAKVVVLAAQPANTAMGAGLSASMCEAAERAARILADVLG